MGIISGKLAIIILAAGEGTRMKSNLPKVLHPLVGEPMISYVVETALALKPERLIVVVGHQADKIREALSGYPCEFVLQEKQQGTGHAVLCAKETLKDFSGHILVLMGDVPLLTPETLSGMITEAHKRQVTALTTRLTNPAGYGRILRDKDDRVAAIVEENDAAPEQKAVTEINTGIWCFSSNALFGALKRITPDNAKGEYYLTDTVAICRKQGIAAQAYSVSEAQEVLGINDRGQLAQASRIIRRRILSAWMLAGVTIEDPETATIERRVKLGRDTVLRSYVILEGDTEVGPECLIGPYVSIKDSRLGKEVTVRSFCDITGTQIRDRAIIGPFARLRPESVVEEEARVGNFVELKKTRLGKGSKANHLTYLGDATVGQGVNIGAGTITCNYDGKHKHPTVVEDDVFIGSGAELIAPVKVGKGAYVAAGSTITEDVPPDALAIARKKQENKEEWVAKKRLTGDS